MKPISVQLNEDYASIMASIQQQMSRFNPDGRVISRAHVVRYALRLAAGALPGEATVHQVLVAEEARGKAPVKAPPDRTRRR